MSDKIERALAKIEAWLDHWEGGDPTCGSTLADVEAILREPEPEPERPAVDVDAVMKHVEEWANQAETGQLSVDDWHYYRNKARRLMEPKT